MTKRRNLLGPVAATAIFALSGCGSEAPAEPDPLVSEATPSSRAAADEAVSTDAVTSNRQSLEAKSPTKEKNDLVVAVEKEGLRLFNPMTSAATPISFGRPAVEVLGTLERLRGAAGKGVNQDCGAGPAEYANWPDGLSLVFQRDRLVGWGLDRRAVDSLSTASGVGPGSTRQELEATYADVQVIKTSLGNEFQAGGFSGLIDGTKASSKITDMWAGISCIAR